MDRQTQYNNATTAEAAQQQEKYMALMNDESKSIEERRKAYESYYIEKTAQAQADLDANTNSYNLRIKKMEDLKEVSLKTADEIKKAMDSGLLTDDEYEEMMDSRIAQTELLAKVEAVAAEEAKKGNKLRTQGLSEELGLLKARTKYYEATHQSILEGEKNLNDDIIKAEEDRLNKSANMQKHAARKEFEIVKAQYDSNTATYKEAYLKYKTEIINIDKTTDDEIVKNQESLIQQQLNILQESLDLFTQKQKEYIKDSTISTQKEVDDRVAILITEQTKRNEIIKKRADSEKWSKDKLTLELLKSEDVYTKGVETLNKTMVSNINKTEKERLADKKNSLKLLSDIEKAYNDSKLLSIDEFYAQEQIKNDENRDLTNQKIEESYANGLITKEEYELALLQIEETHKQTSIDIEKSKTDEKIAEMNKGYNAAMQAISIVEEAQRAASERELAQTEKQYKKEKKLLDSKLKSGLISQEEYDNSIIDLNKAKVKKENEIKKKQFESEKSLNIVKAIMATAMGVANSLSMGMPWGAVLAALSAAAGAVQIANISKQQYVPVEAAGGGILRGPLHAAGGINMGNVEAEGDEFIINRASTQAYEPLLNSINQAGNTNGDPNNVSPLIDYDRLAGAINSKEVIIVDSKINESQQEVEIRDSRVSF